MKKIIWIFITVSMAIRLILLNITQILDLAVSKQYSINDIDSYKELNQIKSTVLYDYKTIFNILVINILFILLYHLIVQRKKYTVLLLIIHIIFIVTVKISDYMYESLIGSKEGFQLINFNYTFIFYLLIINCVFCVFLIFKVCSRRKN